MSWSSGSYLFVKVAIASFYPFVGRAVVDPMGTILRTRLGSELL